MAPEPRFRAAVTLRMGKYLFPAPHTRFEGGRSPFARERAPSCRERLSWIRNGTPSRREEPHSRQERAPSTRERPLPGAGNLFAGRTTSSAGNRPRSSRPRSPSLRNRPRFDRKQSRPRDEDLLPVATHHVPSGPCSLLAGATPFGRAHAFASKKRARLTTRSTRSHRERPRSIGKRLDPGTKDSFPSPSTFFFAQGSAIDAAEHGQHPEALSPSPSTQACNLAEAAVAAAKIVENAGPG
jgi:hypothetical protein